MAKNTATRIANGEYSYRGRNIYRVTSRRDAYNRWKITGGSHFATLALAKAHIDALEDAKQAPQGTAPDAEK